ncbi:GNAT family N-acetyltransferase, partial [Candidatus Bipolaricaulota bacterium]|nr:GNAT family N-acetyltransferase [Candidatus Bipolaricaulota bacterium]
RRGFAKAAMRALEEHVRSEHTSERIELHVFGHNRAARDLYASAGFEETNVIMAKELPSYRNRQWESGQPRPSQPVGPSSQNYHSRRVGCEGWEVAMHMRVVLTLAGLICLVGSVVWTQETPPDPLPALEEIVPANANRIELLRRVEMPERMIIEQMATAAFSPDGTLLAAAGMSRTLAIWRVETGELVHQLMSGGSPWVAVAFNPDGTRLVSGDTRGRVCLFDVETGEQLSRFFPGSMGIHCLDYSPDGQRLLTVNIYDGIRVWDITGERPVLVSLFEGHGQRVNYAQFSPDGTRVASGGGDSRGRIWDATTGEELLELGQPRHFVEGIDFVPDASVVLGASDDGYLYYWNAETGTRTRSVRAHYGPVNGLAIAPSGLVVAKFSNDRYVTLWDVQTGEKLASEREHTDLALRGAFSPDGKLLASVSRDGYVNLWGVPAAE